MDARRRTIFKCIGLLCMAAIGFTTTTSEAASWEPVIEGKIRIEDEAGVPVPYVTVWYAVEQPAEHTRATVWPAAHLSVGDLWRVTQRYGALHDIISSFGDIPVPYLGIPAMGNAEGTFDVRLDYQNETSKGNSFARPDPLTFGYTFLKRGYLPGRVVFTVNKNKNHVEATVKLVKNTSEAVESPPYMRLSTGFVMSCPTIRRTKSRRPKTNGAWFGCATNWSKLLSRPLRQVTKGRRRGFIHACGICRA